MTSLVKSSRVIVGCSIAFLAATVFAQSVLAQAPVQPAAAPAQPAAATVQPAVAPAQPAAVPAQAIPAEPASDSFILREDKMVSQFLLAIAVFFAVIAFLLLVSLPPRSAGDQN